VTGRSTYRARRQQMRVELREANAMRRRGVSVGAMSEAQWEAAVRLAAGKRRLTQCLFDFRYGGDRPDSLNLLPGTDDDGQQGPSRTPPPATAAGTSTAAAGPAGSADGAGAVSDLVELLRAAGVEVEAEQVDADGRQQQQDAAGAAGAAAGGVDEDWDEERSAAREAAVVGEMDEVDTAALADDTVGGQDDQPEAAVAAAAAAAAAAVAEAAAAAAAAAAADQQTRPPAASALSPLPVRSAADSARRAALVAAAEAALSAVREVPGAPPAQASFTGAAAHRQQRQRILQEAADQAGAGGGGSSVHHPLTQPVLPVGGALSSAQVPAEVQAEIQRSLPPRSVLYTERHGAAGTAVDQSRESPIVEVSACGAPPAGGGWELVGGVGLLGRVWRDVGSFPTLTFAFLPAHAMPLQSPPDNTADEPPAG